MHEPNFFKWVQKLYINQFAKLIHIFTVDMQNECKSQRTNDLTTGIYYM